MPSKKTKNQITLPSLKHIKNILQEVLPGIAVFIGGCSILAFVILAAIQATPFKENVPWNNGFWALFGGGILVAWIGAHFLDKTYS